MAVPFYRYSLDAAKSDDCVDLYKKSIEENRRCRDYIEDMETGFYANAYKDNRVDSDGAYTKRLMEEFGMERVLNMYAVTIREHMCDARIDDDVKSWARGFNVAFKNGEQKSSSIITQMNPGIVNILAKHAIKEFENLNLFSWEHCDRSQQNYENKVVIVSHTRLKEEYWSPENQLWLATNGFGCEPDKIGRAVYSTCLADGDRNRWDRGDILGVIKDEYLPDWAREKLEELQAKEQSEENDITLS